MNIALIAHDEMKDTMIGFCIAYERILKKYGLYGTGTTGKRIMDPLFNGPFSITSLIFKPSPLYSGS